jgi:hypothetical protein
MSVFKQWANTQSKRTRERVYPSQEGHYVLSIVNIGTAETREEQPLFFVQFEVEECEPLDGSEDTPHQPGETLDWAKVVEISPKGNLTDKGQYALADLKGFAESVMGGECDETTASAMFGYEETDHNADEYKGLKVSATVKKSVAKSGKHKGKEFANTYFGVYEP